MPIIPLYFGSNNGFKLKNVEGAYMTTISHFDLKRAKINENNIFGSFIQFKLSFSRSLTLV